MMPNTVRVLKAFVLDDPGSGLLNAIQDSAERPWLRINHRVFDSRFVLDRIDASHPVAFHDVYLCAVKVPCLVKPKLIGECDNVGHQRVSIPSITGVAHPPVRAVEVRSSFRVKDPEGMIILVDNRKVTRALKNLQWSRKIGCTGNTGLVALQRRIGGRPISIVGLPLRKRVRLVRNLPVGRIDDDAPGGSDFLLRRMTFDIRVSRVAHLPDAAKTRSLPVPQAGRRERCATLLGLCGASEGQSRDKSAGNGRAENKSRFANLHFTLTFLPPSSSV